METFHLTAPSYVTMKATGARIAQQMAFIVDSDHKVGIKV